jgi:tetratricopeptide (TPR) repeat protein
MNISLNQTFARLLAALLLALCAPAWAQDPGAQRALRLAQQPQDGGILSLGAAMELLPALDDLSPPEQEAALNKALQGRPHPLARALLERRRALLLLNRGDAPAARAIIARQGFVTRWQLLGPFANDSGDALERALAPEIALQLEQETPGRHRPLRWRPLNGADFLGVIDMEALIRPAEGSAAYAVAVLRSPKDQDVVLRIGADAPYQLWLGPHRVATVTDDVGGDIDRDAWGVRLRRGDNLILLKLANQQDLFTWSLRVTDPRGEPLKDLIALDDPAVIQAAAPPPGEPDRLAFADQPPPGATAVKTPLQLLREAAEAIPEGRPPQRALALAQAAALARLHRPRDTNEPWLELLQRARALSPDARVLWLASRAYDQQWQRLDALEEAVQRDPKDPWLRLQRARARYDSAGDLHVTQTLRDLDALIKEHPDFVAPRLLKVQLLQDEGLTQAAFALAWETTQQRPDHPDALRVAFGGAEEAGWPDRLLDLCQQQLRWDAARVSLYGPCATALLKRGRPDEARALLQRALALRPDITGFWGLVADLELALGNPAGAEQALRQMTTLLPDDAQAWARLGKHLAEHGAPDKAAEALSLALTLEPQNAELQEYLAFLKPSAPALEEDFVLTPDPLSPEDEQARYPNEDYVYLIDQQVTRVFPNGLSSRFVQQVARVRTDNGVASLRNLQIAYTPGEERVDILKVRITRPDGQIREVYSVYEQSLSEPWYNLYYDYRAMIISLPDLGRGDTVELQYKLTQISARNVLGDYFGDIWFAQESAPKALARYTLLLPPERQIQARAPSLPGCAAQTQDRAATDNEPALKVHTWTCAQVPGVKNEPDRPGFSQVADYLHLSTWSDWGALARWYWDLIEDQLVVDAEIRRLVAELTSGLADPRQKVSAIHNYVVQNTRYVGLEFGIHGFKPYRTTQCLRRRFGDCKDKASLLKVMLQEAGVEADLVLIRTRNNGAIDANPPASRSLTTPSPTSPPLTSSWTAPPSTPAPASSPGATRARRSSSSRTAAPSASPRPPSSPPATTPSSPAPASTSSPTSPSSTPATPSPATSPPATAAPSRPSRADKRSSPASSARTTPAPASPASSSPTSTASKRTSASPGAPPPPRWPRATPAPCASSPPCAPRASNSASPPGRAASSPWSSATPTPPRRPTSSSSPAAPSPPPHPLTSPWTLPLEASPYGTNGPRRPRRRRPRCASRSSWRSSDTPSRPTSTRRCASGWGRSIKPLGPRWSL